MLIGRDAECARLDELLDRARLGRSAALVVRGEAGIGKTALLEYTAARAQDMTVARALGVESEVELEFSGLLDVCRPLLEHLGDLPSEQASAIESALGLGPPQSLDRFAIGVATLGLLAAAAESRPLLVIADDAQWLDPASAEALLFATRRLHADQVAALFAVREGDVRTFEAPGLDAITVGGLDRASAKQLVSSDSAVAESVAEQLFEAS